MSDIQTANDPQKSDQGTQQYLTFSLAGEEYGVDILSVREIRGWSAVTRVPKSPPFLLGVLNMRGAIVPIMDLRLRFSLPHQDYTATTVTIVVAIGTRNFGMVVDSVSDVLDVNAQDIKSVPNFGAAVNTEYIKGLATSGENMTMLLDVDKLLGYEDWAFLDTPVLESVT